MRQPSTLERDRALTHQRAIHPAYLLGLWTVVGAALRLVNLGSLPPWTDEFATLAFSLGNGFGSVPLDQVISAETLLSPLQVRPEAGPQDVVATLLAESTHPPLYFLLTHGWLQLFGTENGLASVWGARSLSVVFGVALIPAMFGASWLLFRSRAIAHLSALLMAVSPFGLFLARQARHYTLTMLLVLVSTVAFVWAWQALRRRKTLPWLGSIAWVLANALGIATHYFFALVLAAQFLVLAAEAYRQGRRDPKALLQPSWRSLYGVIVATVASGLPWLPIVLAAHASAPTRWIYDGSPLEDFLEPILRLAMWLLSMVFLLPSSATVLPLPLLILSGLGSVAIAVWIGPGLWRGWRRFLRDPATRAVAQPLGLYIGSAIALCLGLTYALGLDLTLAARFHFFYFPALLLALSGTLWMHWRAPQAIAPKGSPWQGSGRSLVVGVLLVGLLGAGVVAANLGYLENRRSDLLVPILRQGTQAPALVAATHKHHGETGRLMSIAWEMRRTQAAPDEVLPQFLLARRDNATRSYGPAIAVLAQALQTLPRPFDLWLVDFRGPVQPEQQNCLPDPDYRGTASEYRYRLYRCR